MFSKTLATKIQEPIDWRYLPYIFGLFVRPKFPGISPAIHMAWKMILTYLHLLDPESFPLIKRCDASWQWENSVLEQWFQCTRINSTTFVVCLQCLVITPWQSEIIKAPSMSPNHVKRVRNHSYGACTPCVLESPFKYAKPDDISRIITISCPLLFVSSTFLFFAPLPSEKWFIFVPHLYLPVITNHSKRKHPI